MSSQEFLEKELIMNNSVLTTIKEHRSIRKYIDKKVDHEKLKKILEAATMASTSGNMQAYSIIVTEKKEMKEKLLKHHFNQEVFDQAPTFLTFCADFNRMRKWLKINNAPENFDNFMSFMIASIDSILASQNAAIAAESLGLGVCYLGTTLASSKKIGEILKLPENVIPIVGFTLGYPDEKPDLRARLPIEAIVHYETYKNYDEKVLKEIYKEKEENGMKRYKDIIKSSNVNVENLAQVYTKLKYTKESHIKYSVDLLDYLKEQQFI